LYTTSRTSCPAGINGWVGWTDWADPQETHPQEIKGVATRIPVTVQSTRIPQTLPTEGMMPETSLAAIH
jgi:hypothetical protein